MKARYFVLALLPIMSVIVNCTRDTVVTESKEYWKTLASSLVLNSREESKKFFTENGWKSFSKNFETDEEYLVFAHFVSGLEITDAEKLSKEGVKLFLGKNNIVKGRIAVIVVKLNSGYKVNEYLAGK